MHLGLFVNVCLCYSSYPTTMLPESEISRDIHDIEDGKSSRRTKLPSELSFEQVVKNAVASVSSIAHIETRWLSLFKLTVVLAMLPWRVYGLFGL